MAPMTPTEMRRVEARVAGRQSARDLIDFLEWSEHDGHGADFADGFLDEMRKLLPKRRDAEPAPVKPEPLSRAAAVVMPFGEHRGKPLGAVPLEYLDWLCREQETFLRSLQTYLRHPDRTP